MDIHEIARRNMQVRNQAIDQATKNLLQEHNLWPAKEYNHGNVVAIQKALESKGFELVTNQRKTPKGTEVFIKLVRIVDQKKLLLLDPTVTFN